MGLTAATEDELRSRANVQHARGHFRAMGERRKTRPATEESTDRAQIVGGAEDPSPTRQSTGMAGEKFRAKARPAERLERPKPAARAADELDERR